MKESVKEKKCKKEDESKGRRKRKLRKQKK